MLSQVAEHPPDVIGREIVSLSAVLCGSNTASPAENRVTHQKTCTAFRSGLTGVILVT